jgi:hypothetical protein
MASTTRPPPVQNRPRLPARKGRDRPKKMVASPAVPRLVLVPLPDRRAESVCVVGNGHSALGRGAEIDAHDFVVRCTSFVTAHRGESGGRVDAWAWFGSPALWPAVLKYPDGKPECWFVLPRAGKAFNGKAMDFAAKVAAERKMPFYCVDPLLFAAARNALKSQPSTGFIAVLMAICRLHPARLTLVGFDATLPTNYGWDEPYPVRPWVTDGKRAFGHNFVLEKMLLDDIAKKKRFGSLAWKTEISWWRGPE